VYSFAMTLLELLTRQHPFPERRQGAAVICALTTETPILGTVQQWLTLVVVQLMQQDNHLAYWDLLRLS